MYFAEVTDGNAQPVVNNIRSAKSNDCCALLAQHFLDGSAEAARVDRRIAV